MDVFAPLISTTKSIFWILEMSLKYSNSMNNNPAAMSGDSYSSVSMRRLCDPLRSVRLRWWPSVRGQSEYITQLKDMSQQRIQCSETEQWLLNNFSDSYTTSHKLQSAHKHDPGNISDHLSIKVHLPYFELQKGLTEGSRKERGNNERAPAWICNHISARLSV